MEGEGFCDPLGIRDESRLQQVFYYRAEVWDLEEKEGHGFTVSLLKRILFMSFNLNTVCSTISLYWVSIHF